MTDGLRLHEPVTLDALAEHPERVRHLSPDTALALLARAEGVVGVLRVAAAVSAEHDGGDTPETPTAGSHDFGLLTVPEAAARAGISPEAFLRRSRFRGAVVRLGHRTLRVDGGKLRRILDRATGA